MSAFFLLAPFFAPDWLTVWILVAAVGALLIGFNRAAAILALWPLSDWLIAPMLQPLLDRIPLVWLIVLALGLAFAVLRAVCEAAWGRQITGHVLGTYIVRLIDLIFLGPFRLLFWIIRLI